MNTRELAQILINIPAVGAERTKKIAASYSGGSLSVHISKLYPFLPISDRAVDKARILADRESELAVRRGISLVSWRDPLYPVSLLSIGDYPPLLYFKGYVPVLTRPLSAALIGSRNAGSGILKATALVGEILAYRGYTIVSGMARGCDTAAHVAALKSREPTIAVLPCGPDYIYPRENSILYGKILEEGGMALSEYGPAVPPAPFRFVRRDRLQSGMARFVVLMASPATGGSMHTATAAAEQKRPLFVYDPGVYTRGELGNRHLINSGRGIPFRTPEELARLISALPGPSCQTSADQLLFSYDK
ncbi:MAG: DNA-protecting protein DprA [Spirochaetales bacterium]|nr:DNA-protecting protein DprA [Spirochaetales bacterium]